MKTSKFFLIILVAGLFTITMNSCKKCRNDEPRARIINNGTEHVSVQIESLGDNTANINNIDPGTATSYRGYAKGQVTFAVVVNNVNLEKQSFDMHECHEYDIAIDADNNITSTTFNRND